MDSFAQERHAKYRLLMERAKGAGPVPMAVAHPCDQTSLEGAAEAAKLGLISPILVGPRAKIEARSSSRSTSAVCRLSTRRTAIVRGRRVARHTHGGRRKLQKRKPDFGDTHDRHESSGNK